MLAAADAVSNQGANKVAAIDRRKLLRDVLPGAVVTIAGVATIGLAIAPTAVEAMPLAAGKTIPLTADEDDLLHDAQVVVVGPRRRPWRRRGRRWVCWWSRGRRVCGWRW